MTALLWKLAAYQIRKENEFETELESTWTILLQKLSSSGSVNIVK